MIFANQMTDADRAQHAKWRAASGDPRGWRVVRQFFLPLTPEPGSPACQEAVGQGGRVRYFKSFKSANRAALGLNGEPVAT